MGGGKSLIASFLVSASAMAQNPLQVQMVPQFYAGGYNISCFGGNNGRINTQVTGGVPPYSYQWSHGATSANVQNLTANTVKTNAWEASPNIDYNIYSTISFKGSLATDSVNIYYGCGNDLKLRKPIILSDGFDPGDERGFIQIFDLISQNNMLNKLRAEGFDIVVLDYLDGAGYIQRNAMIMVELIKSLNEELVLNNSTAQLSIIGPSMGGLIARYALTYMEKNNMNHNTNLFLSFDSPHLGANIPLGVQHSFKFFAEKANSNGAIEALEKINSIAAQQLLLYHHTSFENVNAYRTELLNDEYFTFPIKTRNIAISNGSKNNQKLFNPNVQLIFYSYNASFFQGIIKNIIYAVPDETQGERTIFIGRCPQQVINLYFLQIPHNFSNQTIRVNSTLPLDGLSGGTLETLKDIADSDTDGRGDIVAIHNAHCFIPTISAFSFYQETIDADISNLYSLYFHDNSITPFKSIFANNNNDIHVLIEDPFVLISSDNDYVTWIREEFSPSKKYIQNQIIETNSLFESRDFIVSGENVDPVIGRTLIGDAVFLNDSKSILKAANEINLKPGTHFHFGSESHLFIEDFGCPQVLRISNLNENAFTTINNNDDIFLSGDKNRIHFSNIYPNPSSGIFNISSEFESFSDVLESIEVYNSSGNLVLSSHGTSNLNIDLSNQNDGIYFVRLKINGTYFNHKVVKLGQ